MLILKTNSDLPISVRNLGHSIGQSIKRLEMTFKADLELNNYPKLRSVVEEHLYTMQAVGQNVTKLGDVDTFELDRLYARLSFLQNDYRNSAEMIMNATIDALLNADKDAFDLVAPMCINELDRNFQDELQMSSINRLEELQTLKETTAVSTIAGLLRLDWSAKAFVNDHRQAFEEVARSNEDKYRERMLDQCVDADLEEIDSISEKILKSLDDELVLFTQEQIVPIVAESMNETYDSMFVANEDLAELKSNSAKVADNCMLRGAAKKSILSFNDHLREEVAIQVTDFMKSMKSKSGLIKKVKAVVEEETKRFFETCNFDVYDEDDAVVVTILPVSFNYLGTTFESNYRDQVIAIERVFLGETEIDFSLDKKTLECKVLKEEFDISEIEAHDIESEEAILNLDYKDLDQDCLEGLRAAFESIVEDLKSSIESSVK